MGTPRQELIKMAVIRLKRWKNEDYRITNRFGATRNPRAEDAIEAVVDECLACATDTLGGKILRYYRSASEVAIHRLVLAVDCEAYQYYAAPFLVFSPREPGGDG